MLQGRMILNKYQFIDLTHILSHEISTWTGGCGFNHEIKLDYDNCEGIAKFRVQQLKMHAGIGTHMDAPAHCIPGGSTIAEMPLEQCIAPLKVLDTTAKLREDYQVSIEDLQEFESNFGEIQSGDVVLCNTGWGQLFQDPPAYRNDMMFPSVAAEVAEYLVTKGVNGIAIDTLSPDLPDSDFPVHRSILGAGGYIIENIANAHLLPPIGGYLFAMPIKVTDCTEAPARVFAAIER